MNNPCIYKQLPCAWDACKIFNCQQKIIFSTKESVYTVQTPSKHTNFYRIQINLIQFRS